MNKTNVRAAEETIQSGHGDVMASTTGNVLREIESSPYYTRRLFLQQNRLKYSPLTPKRGGALRHDLTKAVKLSTPSNLVHKLDK